MVYQALAFDGSMREDGFALAGTSAARSDGSQWLGLSDIILGRPDWFAAWLQGENECQCLSCTHLHKAELFFS